MTSFQHVGILTRVRERTLARARTERDQAMGRVNAAAPVEWKEQAWLWLLDYLKTHEEFFPDDVWEAGLQAPPERRAFGPLVAKASRAGYIVKTNQMRPRTLGHATAGPVWKSLIYDG